jgi:electron transfer flavoprotein-quinone oxidoreductase
MPEDLPDDPARRDDPARDDPASGSPEFDVLVVGAGPAGSTAALVLARAGHRVCLLERGPFPGSKNMYGGVVYGRILDTLIPAWWEEAPVQRWVTRRGTVVMTETQALTVDYRTTAWGEAPYNGCTTFRPDFDSWLADKAVEAGAVLVTSTTATSLRRDGRGRIIGVSTDRPDGDLTARVVIACDGVNSFLAKEAGLYPHAVPENFTLGAKEVLALPREEIDKRFGLRSHEGADFEIVGCTQGIAGGGFVYTNLDSIAVGVVLSVTELAKAAIRPEELIAGLKRHPMVAPWVEGADLKEYSAHLIPEGGYEMMPELVTDGMVVAGDAAAMCLAAGIWLEGVNFAIGSGQAAGEAVAAALVAGDTSAAGLASYRDRLEGNFVMTDHRRLRRAPELLMSRRMQTIYPELMCNLAEGMFTVTNPTPKKGALALGWREARRAKVRVRDLVRDGWTTIRTFG